MKGVDVVFMIFQASGECPTTRSPTTIVGFSLQFCNCRSWLVHPLRQSGVKSGAATGRFASHVAGQVNCFSNSAEFRLM
jgi:hypothetical protein